MASDLGVFVVQRETDGIWEASCINEHCGYGMHDVAESKSKTSAEKAATKHRAEIRAELAEIAERAGRQGSKDWYAVAADLERRLSNATTKLFALHRYVRHVKGCGHYWGRACDCGLAEFLVPGMTTTDERNADD